MSKSTFTLVRPANFFVAAFFLCQFCFKPAVAQTGVTSIVTTSYNIAASAAITNRKGAGVRDNANAISTRWDSAGTAFTLNFNASATADSTPITSLVIAGVGNMYIVSAIPVAKVRRVANANVLTAGQHYPFWEKVAAGFPGNAATTGTFDIEAPQITSLETALIANNMNSGYDNVFQNTNANLHYANIERIDYVIPAGITIPAGTNTANLGFTIYDRGVGDPFKMVGISAINATNDPLTYKFANVVSVTAANFGANLLAANFSYVIMQRDPNFNNAEARPSTTGSQNIRGVFVSLASLGFIAGEKVYGFSLMATDVKANPTNAELLNFADNTVYPTNTANANVLDLVNGLSISAENSIVLASAVQLHARYVNNNTGLFWNKAEQSGTKNITIQRSEDAIHFSDIAILNADATNFSENSAHASGRVFYRLKIVKEAGGFTYSNIEVLQAAHLPATRLYPTIARDFLYVDVAGRYVNRQLSANIINASGQVVNRFILNAENVMSIYIGNITTGNYRLVLYDGAEKIFNAAFVKQ